jgi:hypothetical protein
VALISRLREASRKPVCTVPRGQIVERGGEKGGGSRGERYY